MNWVLLGERQSSILEQYLSILSWSKGLEKEIGFGYSKSICNYLGKAFVQDREKDKIYSLVIKKNPIKYIEKMYQVSQKIQRLLNKSPKIDYLAIFNLWILNSVNFYIAKLSSDPYYRSKKTSKKEQLQIESWRNDESLYSQELLTLRRLSRQVRIPVKVLEQLTFDEVKKVLRGQKIEYQSVKQRFNKPWSLQQKADRINLYLKDLGPLPTYQIPKTNVIKGQSVIKLNRIIKGVVGKDILVAVMTRPDMVSQMRAAKAVITDEGGILSHAAIIAREYKIPTVIGTKIATQVLKDGQMVEVDTNKGIVKIL